MTFEQIQEKVKQAAADVWAKIGNPKLPQDVGIAVIQGAMYALLSQEIDGRNGEIRSTVKMAEEIKRNAEAIRQLIKEKDARIAQLEAENARLRNG